MEIKDSTRHPHKTFFKSSTSPFTCVGLFLIFVGVPGLAHSSPALTFMESVGCSVLPMGSCDLLNADNARGIALTYRAVLASKFCGSSNFNEAKQLLEIGDATSPDECKLLVSVIDGG